MAAEQTFKNRGWLSAAVLIPAVAVSCFCRPLAGEGALVDLVFDTIGWLLLGAGVFVRLWATLYIGGRKSTALVTDGPYAACRHPLYVGTFFIMLALAAFLQSPPVLLAAAIATAVHAWVVIPSEERHALACFGPAYQEYIRTTPCLLPHRAPLGRPGKVEVKIGEVLREFSRAYLFIVLGAAAEFVAYCRDLSWWPKPLHLF